MGFRDIESGDIFYDLVLDKIFLFTGNTPLSGGGSCLMYEVDGETHMSFINDNVMDSYFAQAIVYLGKL